MGRNHHLHLAKARALVETTQMPLADIASQCGISLRTVGTHAKNEGWQRPLTTPARHQIIARLWQSASQHLESLDHQLRNGDATTALRDLAVLTKVMRDLMTLDEEAAPDASAASADTKITHADLLARIDRMRALARDAV